MRLGAHVPTADPLGRAAALDAQVVQLFLSAPQRYAAPKERADAERLRTSDVAIYVHAPYLINVATTNNRVRHPSRTLLEQTVRAAEAIGALGVVVHGGHLPEEDDVEAGFAHWRSTLERLETATPILIENTAGGKNAVARHVDRIARLWEVLDGVDTPFGACFDTCHAHAAGEDVLDACERIAQVAGGIDLVHLNDSKDAPGSGRDRHENLGHGRIDAGTLLEVVRRAGADVVVETPDGEAATQADDLAWLRAQL